VFDAKILGVQLFTSGFISLQKPALLPYVGKLEKGDALPALNGGPAPPYYPSGLASRGLEDDSMAIIAGGFGIDLAGAAISFEFDQVRIYTAAVPEPSALMLTLICALSFSSYHRRAH
jgi:hypothetical protein